MKLNDIYVIFFFFRQFFQNPFYILKKVKKMEHTINDLLHEIKNSLAICKGYIEMDLPNHYQILEEEINRSLSLIQTWNSAQMKKEELDLNLLIEDSTEVLEDLFQKNNSEIIMLNEGEYYIQGDYEKLKQALLNILKNAFEAKNNQKLIVVIKTISKKDSYEISIVDNGCGMSEEVMSKVQKGHYTTKKHGTGLGIPFIRKVIESHGGKMILESKINLGTKVLIRLPKEKV